MTYMPSSEHSLQIARGLIDGHTFVHKFGQNEDLDAGVAEDIWANGGDYPFDILDAGISIEILSSDANDTSAGTGARQVTIEGLDASYAAQTETVSMNGLTAVAVTGTWTRIQRAYIATDQAGSGEVNAGNLTIRNAGGSSETVGYIAAGKGQTLLGFYTVAAAMTGYMSQFTVGITGSNSARVDLEIIFREIGSSLPVRRVKEHVTVDGNGTTAYVHPYPVPLVVPAKTDVIFRAESDTNNVGCAITFDLVLVN